MEIVTVLLHLEWMTVDRCNDLIDRSGTAVVEEQQYRLLRSVGRFSRLERLAFGFGISGS